MLFIENTFMTLNENITYYKVMGSSKYFTLGYSWFIRKKIRLIIFLKYQKKI